ncbi:MAG: hypothetical protein ACXQTS_00090 [Candidatus Methanospirareceae archaeon]
MREIINLVTANTRYSKEKATSILKDSDYSCLFLNFPRNQEGFIREIAKGANPWLIIEKMKDLGLVKEPEDVQDYRAAEPIFKCLPSLEVDIYCYKEVASHVLSRESATSILILTAKAKMGKIKVEEWKEVMEEEVYNDIESAEEEADYIARRAKEKNICLDASLDVMHHLSELDFRIKKIILDKFYKPLDILYEKIRAEVLYGKKVKEEEVKRLVKEHLNFVDMIIERGYEEAYRLWNEWKGKEGMDKRS